MSLRELYGRLSRGQRQFLKFGFVGGIGFVIDSSTFLILTQHLDVGPWVAGIISSLVFGMTATWLLNRYLTFRDLRGGSILGQYLRFAAANGTGNLLNIGTRALLIDHLAIFNRIPLLAILIGTVVGLIFNFTGSKYFVFRAADPAP